MARKSRSARRRSAARASARAAAPPVARDGKIADANKPVASSAAEFTQQYSYVYSDLKRIAIMAAAFFAVLIVLSFLIH
jgi:hypothetical protein